MNIKCRYNTAHYTTVNKQVGALYTSDGNNGTYANVRAKCFHTASSRVNIFTFLIIDQTIITTK